MKAISKNLYIRGKSGIAYCRRRIPQALLEAYPPKKTHVSVSLGTSDQRVAMELQKIEDIRIDAEFSRLRGELKKKHADRARKRLDKMSEAQLKALADYWVRQVLLSDERRRSEGLDDAEFEELDSQLQQQRTELGRMLATGRSDRILPAMHGFIHLCGLDVDMSPEESKRAGSVFLSTVITALDHQLQRQCGRVVLTQTVAPPTPTPKEVATEEAIVVAPAVSWDEVFAAWRDYVPGRPKSTAIATHTPWAELQLMATEIGIASPGGVTPELMRKFADRMP